jgi:hypothetical protein
MIQEAVRANCYGYTDEYGVVDGEVNFGEVAEEVIDKLGLSDGLGSQEPNPRISWDEPPDDETLDDFMARDVKWVHFEALDECRWCANIKLANGQLWTLTFGSITGRARGYASAERVE